MAEDPIKPRDGQANQGNTFNLPSEHEIINALPLPKIPEIPKKPVTEQTAPKSILSDTKPIPNFIDQPKTVVVPETKSNNIKPDKEEPEKPIDPKILAKIQKLKVYPIKIKPNKSKKKGNCLKIIIIIIVLLLILAGAAVGLTYFNIKIPYVSKYISKYLKFNEPTNFRTSFRASQEAIKDVISYNIVASVEIGDETLTTAAAKDETSAQEPIVITSDEAIDTNNAQNQTAISYKNLNIYMRADNNSQGSNGVVYISPTKNQDSIFDLSYNITKDNNNFYISPITLYSENESKWQIIKDIKTEKVFRTIVDMLNIKSALAKISEATWQKAEETNIIDYQGKTIASANTNKYKITNTTFSNPNFQNVEASINLIENTNEPIKISVSGDILTVNNTLVPATFDFYYYNFNKKFKIDIPKSTDLKKLTTKEFLTSQGFYGIAQDFDPNSAANKAKKARDARRNADLATLSEVLKRYKENNGHYPISAKVEKTNNSVILKEALISDYLMSLPIDPLDPKYWYGYNSDGTSYRLTSIIEDTGSTAIQGHRVRFQEITK